MAEVKIQEGESIESALRRFKRKVQQEGHQEALLLPEAGRQTACEAGPRPQAQPQEATAGGGVTADFRRHTVDAVNGS